MVSEGRKRRRVTGEGPSYAEPPAGGRTGLGDFEHNQWSVEGEIERLGAFAAGARRAGGWKRVVAWIVAAALLLPLVISAISLVLH